MNKRGVFDGFFPTLFYSYLAYPFSEKSDVTFITNIYFHLNNINKCSRENNTGCTVTTFSKFTPERIAFLPDYMT